MTAGKPFLRFQTGWKRSGDRSRPPTKPGTSALPAAGIVWTVVGFDKLTRRGSSVQPGQPVWTYLWNSAITADHRFVAGLLNEREPKWVVRGSWLIGRAAQ